MGTPMKTKAGAKRLLADEDSPKATSKRSKSDTSAQKAPPKDDKTTKKLETGNKVPTTKLAHRQKRGTNNTIPPRHEDGTKFTYPSNASIPEEPVELNRNLPAVVQNSSGTWFLVGLSRKDYVFVPFNPFIYPSVRFRPWLWKEMDPPEQVYASYAEYFADPGFEAKE